MNSTVVVGITLYVLKVPINIEDPERVVTEVTELVSP